MSIEPENTDLRLSLEVDRGAAGVQRISVRVEGQGALAVQTATRIVDVFERAAAEALRAPANPPLEVQREAGEAAEAAAEAAIKPASPSISEAAPKISSAEKSALPRPTPWFRRARARISGGIGIVLFALAVLVPLIVPPEMRREILPMPIAFGLVGALSLFSAMLPDPAPKRAGAPSQASEIVRADVRVRRIGAGAAVAAPASGLRRMIGIGFGAVFVVGGLAAPFVLAGSSADDRFLMMLGFAPIAAIGAFLIWIFTRKPAASPAMSARRAAPSPASARAPASKMTGALTALAVMLAVVVLLVILATVIQAL